MSTSPSTAEKIPKNMAYESQEEASDSEEREQQTLSPPPSKSRGKSTKKRQQSRGLDMLPRNKAPMSPAGNPALGNAVSNGGGGDKNSGTLRLHLELNLDIEITLKARIHGDLTLALLN